MKHALTLIPLLLALAATPAAAQQPRSISIGQVMAGQLDASDPVLEDGAHYETWSFQARAGQLLVISMGSDDFDTVVYLGQEGGGEFRELRNNDDSLDSTDSSIEFLIPRDGTYLIRSSSFGKDVGGYVLLVFDGS